MVKKLTQILYSGAASVFTLTAMANINSTSLFLLHQPDLPREEDIG